MNAAVGFTKVICLEPLPLYVFIIDFANWYCGGSFRIIFFACEKSIGLANRP